MSISTTRSLRNRSSRYSSPATFADNTASSKPVESQKNSNDFQTSLDKWVEPTVRNPVPSFEDTRGLERVGVLEHMAPLGVAPSQKLLQKLKVNLNRSSPRMTPINVDEVTPPMESARMDVASPIDTEPLPEPVRVEEPVIISSPPRGRPAKKELDEMRQIHAIDLTTPSPVKTSFPSVQPSPLPQSLQDYIRQDRLKSVIDRAILEANIHSDQKLIPGLRLLHDDAKTKPQLWPVLEAVLHRTPTDAQFSVFKKYIKKGVKHYRRNASPTVNHTSSSYSQPVGFLHTFQSQGVPTGHSLSNSQEINSPFRFKPSDVSEMSPTYRNTMSPTNRMASFSTDTHLSPGVRRKRSRSASTTSSLSSAKSMPEEFSPETIEVDADADADGQAAEGRPVRSTGPRQAANRVAAESRSRLSGVSQPESSQPTLQYPTSIKFISKKSKSSSKKDEPSYDPEKIEVRRREFENNSFYDYNTIHRPYSDERSVTQGRTVSDDSLLNRVPPPVIHPNSLQTSAASLFSPPEIQARPDFPMLNGTSRKRPYDEIDKDEIDIGSPVSSSPAPFLPPPAPVTANSIRGSTPRITRLPPPNKMRKSARVMVSPNKPKNGGITAGISRAGPARDSLIGNGAESGGEDNDEFCASCSGEGILLCCDGCTNSFHHGCLEPPLDPEDDVEGEWYCPRCIAKRSKELLPATGLLGQPIRKLDHIIPKAYSLPYEIRDYYEGVKTGDEGEYEEIGLPRTQSTGAKMNRAGFVEEPSYKELRDSKGNFIICYRCQKTSGGRDIIPCDYCPAKWHTDCIDPPLAVPPRRRGGDKPTGYWKCPLHIDGDLAEIGRQPDAAPGDLGRVPRLRKPKKAFPINVDLARGFRNNGVIEVELMKEEIPDIREVTLDSGIYRLPEKGIRLDFIDRVKKSWYEDQTFPRQFNSLPRIRNRLYRPEDPVLHHPAAYTVVRHKESDFLRGVTAVSVAETARANARLRHRSFKEQSAVMSLVGLSEQTPNGYSIDPLADLTNTLVAEASDEVAAAINSSEKESLLKLQRLINNRLAFLENASQQKLAKPGKKQASSEPGLTNGDVSEQLNGDVDADGDGEDEGGDETDTIS